LHSLLERQLKRRFGASLPPSQAWLDFAKDLDEAYRQFDTDRRMLERSLELSSQELLQANKEIRTWAEVQLERSEEHYRALIENGSDIITVLAANGEITYTSPSVMRVLGYEPDELIGKIAFELVHPDDLPDVANKFAAVVTNPGTSEVVEFRFRHKGGSWQILEAAGRAHTGNDGLDVIVNSRDVTDRRQAEETSRENAELFSKAFQASPVAIAINDGETGAYLNVNGTFLRLLGYSAEEVVGRSSGEIELWEDPVERERFGQALARSGSVNNFETVFRTRSGDLLYGVLSAELIELNGRSCVLSITHDITERKQAEQTINHLAYHDPLTGLPNRALFRDRLNTALARARRRGEAVTVMFLDLDRFKLVNDTLGHAIGDSLLQSVASQLKQLLRDEDTIARIGGDEFTILLPNLALGDVTRVVERVLECVKAPRSLGGREMRVTTSIGICQFPEDGDDSETLMRNADIAMYRAKEQGRDGYTLYNESLDPAAEGRLALENDLRAAIEHEEFVLFYQPVVNVEGGHVVAFEALVRWQHPERGLVAPGEFIPIAEETGLILPLGEWVIRTACRQAKAWQDAGLPAVPVAVNLSGYRFHRSEHCAYISQVLKETGLEPKYLHLEITEGVVLQDIERTVEILSDLRKMGVQISIDDFGTGYSSLSYLKRLPADSVKIDRSFVSDLDTDANDAAIATAIIAMAHSIGLKVIAEGVETEEQLAFLRQRRCDEFQGFLRARPMPASEVELLLADEGTAILAR
jgi:diguanylate cyclase (GGDEF)-like protein/PAS domain S-box-containing protein